MSFRFKWGIYCLLSLSLHLTQLPAAAEAPDASTTPTPTTSVEAAPSMAPPLAVPSTQGATSPSPTPSPLSERHSLANLISKEEISVLSDSDGKFVRHLTETRFLDEEGALRTDRIDLPDSLSIGRGFNRENLAAQARSEQAEAQSGQARALLLPSVNIHFNAGSETSDPSILPEGGTGPSDTHPRTDSSIMVTQPLYDLPSFLEWRRRKTIAEARKDSYRASDSDTYTAIVNSYLSLVSSRIQADLTRDFESRLSDLLTYIEKRAGAGAASVSDMARVQARSQATLSSRLEQESACAAAGIEFTRLTNRAPQRLLLPVPEDVGATQIPVTFDAAVAAAMETNPDIAALNAEVKAAKLQMSAAGSRFQPRIKAEYTDTESYNAGGSEKTQKDQRLMLVLDWNLFNGGGDLLAHTENSAKHKEMQYRLDDQRRRVIQSLSANYATLETTRERISSGYRELEAISTAVDAMSQRMLSGNQSLLDLLDVYDRYYQVRSRLVTLHILEINTTAQIVRLTRGTPETSGAQSSAPKQGPKDTTGADADLPTPPEG